MLDVAYVGRRAYHLLGAYNVNQAQIINNGFLDAFNVVKAGGDSPLMDKLLTADSRLNPGETGSQMVRRLDRRMKQMEAEGVIFKPGVNVGADLPADRLLAEFDAVCLCGGATQARVSMPPRSTKSAPGRRATRRSTPSRTWWRTVSSVGLPSSAARAASRSHRALMSRPRRRAAGRSIRRRGFPRYQRSYIRAVG